MRDRVARDLANSVDGKLPNYAWNIDKGLRNWRAALANAPIAATSPAVVFMGDSITNGAGTTNGYQNGFVGMFRQAIQLAFGLAGTGFTSVGTNFSADASWTILNTGGTNLSTAKATPTSTNGAFGDYFTSVDVVYSTYPDGGTATVQIDGVAVGTINCNGPISYHNIATFTASAFIQHTVTIVPATSGNTYVEGFITRTGQKGVLVHQVGHPGIQAAQYTDPKAITASTSAFSPKLTVIMLGTNDAGNNIPLATYSAQLDALVKQSLTTGDVLIMMMGDRGTATTIPWTSYVANAKQVAINNNCAFMSIYDRWNQSFTWPNSQGFMSGDGIHPTNQGHADIVEALRSVLGGMPNLGALGLITDGGAQLSGDLFLKLPGMLRLLNGIRVVASDLFSNIFEVLPGSTKNQIIITTQGSSFAQLSLGTASIYADTSGNVNINLGSNGILQLNGPTHINLLTKATLGSASGRANYFCSISDYAVGKTPLVYSDGTIWRYVMDGTAV